MQGLLRPRLSKTHKTVNTSPRMPKMPEPTIDLPTTDPPQRHAFQSREDYSTPSFSGLPATPALGRARSCGEPCSVHHTHLAGLCAVEPRCLYRRHAVCTRRKIGAFAKCERRNWRMPPENWPGDGCQRGRCSGTASSLEPLHLRASAAAVLSPSKRTLLWQPHRWSRFI